MFREGGRLFSSLQSPKQSFHHEIDVNKLAGAAKLEKDFPYELSLDSVESFGEIDKGHKQVLMLFSAFLLQLSSCENHVHHAPALPETDSGSTDSAMLLISF